MRERATEPRTPAPASPRPAAIRSGCRRTLIGAAVFAAVVPGAARSDGTGQNAVAAPPSGRSDTTDRAATPRSYQEAFAAGDVFGAAAYLDALASRQPVSVPARRTVMVERIRANVAAAGSTIDMAAVDRALAVMGAIPREAFVPPARSRYAYLPFPVEIGYGQTISDAYIVAVMTAAAGVGSDSVVLDVGTGSGYQAAVLAALVERVVSIEIVKPLAARARKRLRTLGYRNVTVLARDGYKGAPGNAPFDAIIVAAGATAVPRPLLDQLKIGGRLVIPVGPTFERERLMVVRRTGVSAYSRCSLGKAGFVPMTGRARAAPGAEIEDAVSLCYGRPVT